jgi:hypothetical protein
MPVAKCRLQLTPLAEMFPVSDQNSLFFEISSLLA